MTFLFCHRIWDNNINPPKFNWRVNRFHCKDCRARTILARRSLTWRSFIGSGSLIPLKFLLHKHPLKLVLGWDRNFLLKRSLQKKEARVHIKARSPKKKFTLPAGWRPKATNLAFISIFDELQWATFSRSLGAESYLAMEETSLIFKWRLKRKLTSQKLNRITKIKMPMVLTGLCSPQQPHSSHLRQRNISLSKSYPRKKFQRIFSVRRRPFNIYLTLSWIFSFTWYHLRRMRGSNWKLWMFLKIWIAQIVC